MSKINAKQENSSKRLMTHARWRRGLSAKATSCTTRRKLNCKVQGTRRWKGDRSQRSRRRLVEAIPRWMLPFFDAPETSWAPGTPGTVTTRKDTNPSALPGRTNSWLLSNSSRGHTIPATNDTCTFFPPFFGRSTQNVVELSMRFMSKPVQFQNSSGCFVCRSYYSCDYFRD